MKIKFRYIPDSDSFLQEIDTQNISTIKELKMKISENQNFNIENIKIIFLGKILKDTQLINDCNIDSGSTLHVVIRKNKDQTNTQNTNTVPPDNQNNTNNFSNIESVFNQINENFQSAEFQNNVSSLLNTMGQLQQNLQSTVQDEQFQNNITNTMNNLTQDLQNTVQSEEFQNNITNTVNNLNQSFQNFQNNQSNQYNEDQENKITLLLNLNIINDRNNIIELLKDNNWDEEAVANTLLFYSN